MRFSAFPLVSAALALAIILSVTACERDKGTAQASSQAGEASVPEEEAETGVRLSARELSDLTALHAEMTPHVANRLSLSNALHYRVLMAALERSGESPDKSPELFRRLQAAHKRGFAALDGAAPPTAVAAVTEDDDPANPQDLNFIASLSEIANTQSDHQATALSSIVGGTQQTSISLELYTLSNGHVYASTSQSQYAQGVNFSLSVSGTETSGDGTTQAMAYFIYTPNTSRAALGEEAEPLVLAANSAQASTVNTVNPTAACMQQPNYCVRNGSNCVQGQYQTTCTNEVDNRTPIKTCWYRGSQAECDYWNSTAHPTNLTFPMSGNATFPNQVVTPANPAVTIALQNPTNGGGCNVFFQNSSDPQYWSASGATISWNFPAAAFPNTGDCIAYYDGTTANLWMQAAVPLQGTGSGQPPYGSLNFTSDRSQIGIPGIYIIPQMYIVQGCYAAGTQITLADGTTGMAIEDFSGNQDEYVVDGDGRRRLVGGTTAGREPKPMIRLKTDRGHDLLLTEGHPVIKADGKAVKAKALTVGEAVRTLEGEATLTEVGPETYEGRVHNLVLAPVDQSSHLPPDEGSTLYAGGILTGDGQMQNWLARQTLQVLSSDPDAVRERLDEAWLRDFENHQ